VKGFVTTLIHGDDFVPCLSLGSVRDVRRVAVNMDTTACQEILQHQKKFQEKEHQVTTTGTDFSKQAHQPEHTDMEIWWATIKTLRADMTHEKLCPPGDVYWIRMDQEQHRLHMRKVPHPDRMCTEIYFSPNMVWDHTPGMYAWAVDHLSQ
jgi:hypothetical protein